MKSARDIVVFSTKWKQWKSTSVYPCLRLRYPFYWKFLWVSNCVISKCIQSLTGISTVTKGDGVQWRIKWEYFFIHSQFKWYMIDASISSMDDLLHITDLLNIWYYKWWTAYTMNGIYINSFYTARNTSLVTEHSQRVLRETKRKIIRYTPLIKVSSCFFLCLLLRSFKCHSGNKEKIDGADKTRGCASYGTGVWRVALTLLPHRIPSTHTHHTAKSDTVCWHKFSRWVYVCCADRGV